MTELDKLVRPNIRELKPYSSARDEFSGVEGTFLDANENPFGDMNRYPDPQQKKLKQKLSEIKNLPAENIFLGNGSDEIIDLCFRIFCEPGKEKALTFTPTYGMYEVSANINNVELVKLPLDENFQIDTASVQTIISQENLKLIFICSPNNPTGNSIDDIDLILNNFKGIVVVDEAYADFNKAGSLKEKLVEFPNLILLQTLSKAWGMAALRIGMAFASPEITAYLNKVKPPYNISKINQEMALKMLEEEVQFNEQIQFISQEKKWVIDQLSQLEIVKKIYPSETNFILAEVSAADELYNLLVEQKIIVRNRSREINNCLRITIGTSEQNRLLIQTLQKIQP